MLDIRFIKENVELIKTNLKKKAQQDKFKVVDEIIAGYETSLKLKQQSEELRRKRNELSLKVNELGESLNLFDFDASARISGNGFYYLKGELALLNQALIRYAIDFMSKKNYLYIESPLMVNRRIEEAKGDFTAFEKALYKIENEDHFLIPTAEDAILGMLADQTIPEDKLPLKFFAYSMSFRKEIGSHGINEKGLCRTHQFNKVEMIVICKPEESMKFFEELKNITIEIFKELEIPVRVLEICSGDLGDLKHKQFDIEAWSPKLKDYYA